MHVTVFSMCIQVAPISEEMLEAPMMTRWVETMHSTPVLHLLFVSVCCACVCVCVCSGEYCVCVMHMYSLTHTITITINNSNNQYNNNLGHQDTPVQQPTPLTTLPPPPQPVPISYPNNNLGHHFLSLLSLQCFILRQPSSLTHHQW